MLVQTFPSFSSKLASPIAYFLAIYLEAGLPPKFPVLPYSFL